MRLIDADALFEKGTMLIPSQYYEGALIVINAIRNAPTIEAEPIKHGRWELVEDDFYGLIAKCSVCGEKTYNAVSWDFKGNEYRYPYCPNCGAKMDEVKHERI